MPEVLYRHYIASVRASVVASVMNGVGWILPRTVSGYGGVMVNPIGTNWLRRSSCSARHGMPCQLHCRNATGTKEAPTQLRHHQSRRCASTSLDISLLFPPPTASTYRIFPTHATQRSNVMSSSAGKSRAERFEDEKRRIIESCFSKRDEDGSGVLPNSPSPTLSPVNRPC